MAWIQHQQCCRRCCAKLRFPTCLQGTSHTGWGHCPSQAWKLPLSFQLDDLALVTRLLACLLACLLVCQLDSFFQLIVMLTLQVRRSRQARAVSQEWLRQISEPSCRQQTVSFLNLWTWISETLNMNTFWTWIWNLSMECLLAHLQCQQPSSSEANLRLTVDHA